MRPLSNSGQQHDAPPASSPDTSVGVQCRCVARHETDAALRLLLAGPHGRASDEQVRGFLSIASHRGLDPGAMWVAVDGSQLLWALLPVVSPGRTMLLLTPPHLPKLPQLNLIGSLVDKVCDVHRGKGIELAQMLLDPAEVALRRFY